MTFLEDKEFLKALSNQKNLITYAKVILLTKDGSPVESLGGKVLSGSISIDGTSAVRRTCSLNIFITEEKFTNFQIDTHAKFNVQIGLKNLIDSRYPEVCWFNQGVFIETQFSYSQSLTGFTYSISGKDKMCLLNGEVSGTLLSPINFGEMQWIDAGGNGSKISYPIKDIILEAVHAYGNESYDNIIINDLPESGFQLMEYRNITPGQLFLIKNIDTNSYSLVDSFTFYTESGTIVTNSNYNTADIVFAKLSDLVDKSDPALKPTILIDKKDDQWVEYYLHPLEYGDVVGYSPTDLTYPGDLIAQAGDSLTTILDKIKNMLGEDYEYFYDIDGRFVFQKSKKYINTSWQPLTFYTDGGSIVTKIEENENFYNFDNMENITNISYAPDLNKIKNDFTIWGENALKNPIHMRYAIDEKPKKYYSVAVTQEEANEWNDLHPDNLIWPQESILYSTDPIIEKSSSKKYVEEKLSLGKCDIKVGNINGDSKYYTILTEEQIADYTSFFKDVNDRKALVNNKITTKVSLQDDNKLVFDKSMFGFLIALYDVTLIKQVEVSEEDSKIIEDSAVDWREIIYQMAQDSSQYGHLDNFSYKIIQANKSLGLYQNGKTGYEQYYIDIISFWRDLYDINGFYSEITAAEANATEGQPIFTSTYFEQIKVDDTNYIDYENWYVNDGGKYYSYIDYVNPISNVGLSENGSRVWIKNNDSYSLVEVDAYNLEYKRKNFSKLYATNGLTTKIGVKDSDSFVARAKDEAGDYNVYRFVKLSSGTQRIEPEQLLDTKKIYKVGYEITRNKGDLLKQIIEKHTTTTEVKESKELHYFWRPKWNLNVLTQPSKLTYWLDFLDSTGPIQQYSIKAIGDRPKITSGQNIKSLWYLDVPNILLVLEDNPISPSFSNASYEIVNIPPEKASWFTISSQGNTAKQALETDLQNCSYLQTGITLNTFPHYYFEPNTRITLYNKANNKYGKYIVNKISYQISHNSMMSISGNEIIESLY